MSPHQHFYSTMLTRVHMYFCFCADVKHFLKEPPVSVFFFLQHRKTLSMEDFEGL